jgi:hypothetical protein
MTTIMAQRDKLFVAEVFLLLICHVVGCEQGTGVAPRDGEGAVGQQTGAALGTKETNQPTVTASPNPVPAGKGNGSTRIAWNSGDDSWSQIYIAIDGVESKMVAQGARGIKEIDWIKSGRTYEFRLYAGKERQTLLAKVVVTRASQ